jgi:bacterioferritin-associated ferredoxin
MSAMFICVCKAVSDKRIRRAVADGATTVRDLSRSTGLGTCCGKCVPAARELLEETLATSGPVLRLADLTPRQAAAASA